MQVRAKIFRTVTLAVLTGAAGVALYMQFFVLPAKHVEPPRRVISTAFAEPAGQSPGTLAGYHALIWINA